MTSVLPLPLMSLLIVLLWLILAPSFSLGHLLLGGLLGLAIPLLTRRFWEKPPHLYRPFLACGFVLRVLADIVIANLEVALLVLGPVDRPKPAFIEIPLDIDDLFIATILGSIISLTPGTVSIEIDRERKILLVHALDAADPDALIATIKSRYERPLKEIFQC